MTSDKKNPYIALGKHLSELRSHQGWSLRRASQQIGGLSHSRLQDFERGTDPHSGIPTRPSEDQICRIARAYRVQPELLLVLAGYSPVGRLDEFEGRLIRMARLLNEGEKKALLDYLENLIERGESERDQA